MIEFEKDGNENKSCQHFADIDEKKVSPRTPACEDCDKERGNRLGRFTYVFRVWSCWML